MLLGSIGGTGLKKNTQKTKYRNLNYIWEKYNLKWVVVITIWTFFLTILFTIISEVILQNTRAYLSFIILILIVFLGVFSDMIGIAITAASDKPFHAMASDKVKGSKYAIKLKKNTGVVANFANDVVGDICGIISGVAGASIIMSIESGNRWILTVILTSFIAALTVGGKAVGKNIAVYKSHIIVFNTAKVLDRIKDAFGIDLLKDK